MIWLLRLFWREGQEYLFASEPCAPLDGDGEPIFHAAGLEIGSFEEAAGIGDTAIGECSASASILAPDVDWAALHLTLGLRFDTARAELALWAEGASYEARTVLLMGDVSAGSIPILGAPLEIEIGQALLTAARPYPPDDATLDTTAWPDLPTSSDEGSDTEGTPYTAWLGAGGLFTTSSGVVRRRSCILCPLVDDSPDVILVSYGHLTAVTAEVWSTENASRATLTLTRTTDGRGYPVTTAALAGSGWTWAGTAADDTFYVVEISGGLTSPITSSGVIGLGEACLWLLLQRYDASGQAERVDISAWDAVRPWLDQIQIGVLLEGGDPLDVITGDLLPLVPALSIAGGPRGLRPLYLADTPPDACPLLVACDGDEHGPDLYREEDAQPEIVAGDVANDVIVRFARRLADGEYKAIVRASAANDGLAAASVGRWGTRAAVIESAALWQRASAWRVTQERIRVSHQPGVSDEWWAPLDVGAGLVLAARYRVQDDEACHAERPMWLVGRSLTEDRAGFLCTFLAI